MTRLEIAARILAGWAANPNERGTREEAAAVALSLADALLDAAEKPAPPFAPVKFDEDGYGLAANGEIATSMPNGWEAELCDHLAVYVVLRPGEDAGELTARMLASVGRVP